MRKPIKGNLRTGSLSPQRDDKDSAPSLTLQASPSAASHLTTPSLHSVLLSTALPPPPLPHFVSALVNSSRRPRRGQLGRTEERGARVHPPAMASGD
jgi:hypothetical protein